jgi:hypothetical protein
MKPQESYKRRSILVKATQWLKPGDHPKVFNIGCNGSLHSTICGDKYCPVEKGNWILEHTSSGRQEVLSNKEFKKEYYQVDKEG